MKKPLSQATTLTPRTSPDSHLLEPGQIVHSPETHMRYRIERLLGFGGYGQVYMARHLGRWSGVPDVLCIKASPHMDAWLREAYFGQLLDEHPRAIRVFDRFVLMRNRNLDTAQGESMPRLTRGARASGSA